MATCDISSDFIITIDNTATNGANGALITNPGRAFRITKVLVTGTAGADVTIRKNTIGGVIAATGVVAAAYSVNDYPLTVTEANSYFLATDNIWMLDITQIATKICIYCEAYAPQALSYSIA